MMNERIRELGRQATIWCVDQPNQEDFDAMWEEKFAELIIRECSLIPDWCIETGKDQFVETCMAERTSKMIKQHFGVE
jgi:hypothetical protein